MATTTTRDDEPPGNEVRTYHRDVQGSPLGEHFGGSAGDLSEGSRWKRSKSPLSWASSDFDMEEAEAEDNYILISDEE
jgi:hypothetical protein